MHDSAYHFAQKFFQNYWEDRFNNVLELGSSSANGSIRDHCPKTANYIGMDTIAAAGVDVVIPKDGRIPLKDGAVDVIVASSFFQNDPCFWQTFLELLRILRPGGLVYVNTPSNHHVHRNPLDCWRFYPDAGVALVEWARRNSAPVHLIESFVAEPMLSGWSDFVAVFHKPGIPYEFRGFIADESRAFNVHFAEATEIARPSGYTFDGITIADLKKELATSKVEQHVAMQANVRNNIKINALTEENEILRFELSKIHNSWLGKMSARAQSFSDRLKKRYLG